MKRISIITLSAAFLAITFSYSSFAVELTAEELAGLKVAAGNLRFHLNAKPTQEVNGFGATKEEREAHASQMESIRAGATSSQGKGIGAVKLFNKDGSAVSTDKASEEKIHVGVKVAKSIDPKSPDFDVDLAVNQGVESVQKRVNGKWIIDEEKTAAKKVELRARLLEEHKAAMAGQAGQVKKSGEVAQVAAPAAPVKKERARRISHAGKPLPPTPDMVGPGLCDKKPAVASTEQVNKLARMFQNVGLL